MVFVRGRGKTRFGEGTGGGLPLWPLRGPISRELRSVYIRIGSSSPPIDGLSASPFDRVEPTRSSILLCVFPCGARRPNTAQEAAFKAPKEHHLQGRPVTRRP